MCNRHLVRQAVSLSPFLPLRAHALLVTQHHEWATVASHRAVVSRHLHFYRVTILAGIVALFHTNLVLMTAARQGCRQALCDVTCTTMFKCSFCPVLDESKHCEFVTWIRPVKSKVNAVYGALCRKRFLLGNMSRSTDKSRQK